MHVRPIGSLYNNSAVTVTRRGGVENDTVEYVHMARPQAGVSSSPKGGRCGLGRKGILCGEAIRGRRRRDEKVMSVFSCDKTFSYSIPEACPCLVDL
jgi:hypothetical protein